MKIRTGVFRYKAKHGKMVTHFTIEKWTLFGWEILYHHGFKMYRFRKDAEEFVRLYKSLKK